MHVASLAIYPIKSTRAVPLETAAVGTIGLAHDRRWMLVDEGNRFISQREEPRLATVETGLGESGLTLTLPGDPPIEIKASKGRARIAADIWDQIVESAIADETVNQRLSAFLGRPVRLVFMDEAARRLANPDWTGDAAPVSFADAYPILLTTTASLDALNDVIRAEGGAPVEMERFRPNIVVKSSPAAWEEDGWATIRLGDLTFDLVKPCDRCIVPTLDQESGEARRDNQPTKALIKTRRSADPRVKGVLFGWNVIARESGVIRVGDEATILETREPWPIR